MTRELLYALTIIRRKCLRWSVEWILPDFSRYLGSIRANQPLSDFIGRDGQYEEPSKRRKLETPRGADTETPVINQGEDTSEGKPPGSVKQEDHGDSNGSRQSISGNSEQKLHFYLHRPYTSSSSRVLIPLSSAATFSSCLRGRDILEFPTIYILREPPSVLPQGYVLEKEYLRQRQNLVKEVDEVLGDQYSQDSQRAGSMKKIEVEDHGPSDSRILESLPRDIDVVQQYI